jgi:hypothetical protein
VACDPNTLLDDAKCLLDCLPPGAMRPVKVSLLCNFAQFHSPLNISGLARWWRADTINLADGSPIGAAGQEWRDSIVGQLGGQAVAGNRPTLQTNGIGGKPAVKLTHLFAGAAQFLDLSFPASLVISGDFTLIIVAKYVLLANGEFGFFFTSPVGTTHIAGTRDGSLRYTPDLQDDTGSRLTIVFAGANLALANHALIWRRLGSAANNVTALYNNSQTLIGSNAAAAVYTLTKIVGTGSGAASDITFLVSEILLWNRALTDAELAGLYSAYLKPRYALS